MLQYEQSFSNLLTLEVKISDIPYCFRGGGFYRSLDKNNPESTIPVPSDCLVLSRNSARNLTEFCQLVKMMEFWMLDEPLPGFLAFAKANRVQVWRNTVAAAFGGECAQEFARHLRITIKHSDIPTFLHVGKFYRNLDIDDPEGTIEIPADCFHPDGQTAADLGEFHLLLRVMAFWVLDDIPFGVLDFCSDHDVVEWETGLVDLPGNVAAEVLPLLLTTYSKSQRVPFKDVIATGRWDLIMHAASRITKTNTHATDTAVFAGDVRLLEYLFKEGFIWSEDTTAMASQEGHLNCLRYAHENGCPWDKQATECAAEHDHLECLRYAHENGCPWDFNVYVYAAGYGHLTCMQYAHEQGLKWEERVCAVAALGGHLECLQFAHENGCPSDMQTTKYAAQEGHAHCLQYALEHGFLVYEKACNLACKNGHLRCLQLLHEVGVTWTVFLSVHAACCANAACLQYLHENGCPWDSKTSGQAAFQGHIEPLRYALEHGCPHSVHVQIVRSAAHSNNLECLRYLVEEQGLFMDEKVFMVALLRGNMIHIKYLVDQGCPFLEAELPCDEWEWEVWDHTFQKDNPEFVLCVEYAVERGWTPDEHFIRYIVTRDEPCKDWLITENFYVSETTGDESDAVSTLAKRKYDELL